MKFAKKQPSPNKPHQFNVIIGYFYILNYFLGSGFLSISFVFYNVGMIPSLITLSILCIVGCITALWLLEIMGRSRVLNEHNLGSEGTMLLENDDTSRGGAEDFYSISETRKFEMTEICNLMFGWGGKLIFISLMSIYSTLTLWSFAAVVGTSWSTNIPINTSYVIKCHETDFTKQLFPTIEECAHLYRICVTIFGLLVIALSLLELNEQKNIQVFFSVVRFTALISIITFSTYLIVHNAIHPNATIPAEIRSVNSTATSILYRFNFNWLITSIPIMCNSLNIHLGIPSLTHPVHPKTHLKRLIIAIYITIWFIYSVLGITVSTAYRNLVNENLTLTWSYFTGAQNNIAVRVLSYFIMLFPSMDLTSAYPLVVITLSNNVYSAIMCRDTSEYTMNWEDRRKRMLFRFFFALFPLIGAMFISNLVAVINIAGIFAFTIIFFVPTTCQFISKYFCNKVRRNHMRTIIAPKSLNTGAPGFVFQRYTLRDLKEFLFTMKAKTPYSGWYSINLVNIVISIVAVLCFSLGIVSLKIMH